MWPGWLNLFKGLGLMTESVFYWQHWDLPLQICFLAQYAIVTT